MTEIAKSVRIYFNEKNRQTNCLNASSKKIQYIFILSTSAKKLQQQTQNSQIIILLIVAYFRGKFKQISLSLILMNLTIPSSSSSSSGATTTSTIVHDMLDTSSAVTTLLASQTKAFNTTTAFPATTVQTVASFITASNKNRATHIIVYPTVAPESVVIPIVSCIFGFPILAFLVICCLRRRAKLARERDRRRNYDNMQDHAVSLVRFSPIHRLNNRSTRAISLRPERSLSQGFPSL